VSDFWKEFLRVNCDKFVLLVLILLMLHLHSDERLIYLALGGLVGAITHNRWQRNP